MSFIDLIDRIVQTSDVCRSILEGNEAQTRWLLIDTLLLDGLGYNRSDIQVEFSLDSEERVNRYDKLDYCVLLNNKPKLLIEAKSLGIDLFEKYSQLEKYFNAVQKMYDYNQKELIGCLTDGDLYLFYTDIIECGKIDREPFFTIKLSISEDLERLKLLKYSKENVSIKVNTDIITSEEVYELYTPYRIDVIENVFNYFKSQSQEVDIDSVWLKGRLVKGINTFRKLYRHLISEVNKLKPDLLYSLALEEDIQENGKIANTKFSCKPINSRNIEFETKNGKVYITVPNTNIGIIERINYLVRVSGYGIHNVVLSIGNKVVK